MMIDTHIYAAGIAPPVAAPPPGNAGQPKAKLPQPGNANSKLAKANGKASKGKLSPGAQHVQDHIADPLGATKEGFTDLTNKKLQYDQARENMQRELSMPQAVINHVSQIHGIIPGQPAGQQPTPGMTGNQPQIDPATGLPMQGQPGQDPNDPGMNDNPDMDPMSGNPANMNQTPGQMNQNRPSMAGHQPGVSPGPSENVRPGKMGIPQPGGLPQNNKQAAPPKGSKSLPGAKGPGDPKVGNKTKKAQGQSSRAIKINVAASTSCSVGVPVIHASRTIGKTFGIASLMAGGPGSGRHPGYGQFKRVGYNRVDEKKFGTDQFDKWQHKATGTTVHIIDKYPGNGATVKENGRTRFKGGDSGADKFLKSRYGIDQSSWEAAGTSSGAKKHWSVRNKGPLSKKEKDAHFKTMDAMMPSGGMIRPSMGNVNRSPSSAPGGGMHGTPARRMLEAKKIKAGPAQLEDKVSDSGAELAYNPVSQPGGSKLSAGKVKHMKGCSCAKCKGMSAGSENMRGRVKVHKPGHPHHGHVGTIVRGYKNSGKPGVYTVKFDDNSANIFPDTNLQGQ